MNRLSLDPETGMFERLVNIGDILVSDSVNKNNIIVIGDLLYRFPNKVEKEGSNFTRYFMIETPE